MKVAKPLFQLTSYYLIIGLALWVILLVFPDFAAYLPIGGTGEASAGMAEFITGEVNRIAFEPAQAIRLALCLFGVLLVMQPIAWSYIGARRRKGKDQAFIITLLVLPLAVAGIVMIVQNSLALAFSLAGIVAGVRFRLTLEDTLDAVFIFTAIGIGLACGIEALEIAAVISIFFNYTMLLLWQMDYGEAYSGGHWFSRTWMNPGNDQDTGKKRGKKAGATELPDDDHSLNQPGDSVAP